MANTIKLKRASGSDPGNSDLAAGELAIRTSNCKLFSKNDSGSAIGIVAGSADTLTTARTIAGVSFDGSANISLNNNAITNGAGYLADIVSDSSPQLGGALDTNGSNINFGDSTSNGNNVNRLRFGTATNGDLEIYHDGSNSYITDRGTGELRLYAAEVLRIRDTDSAEDMAVFNKNGSVELFHNNSKKFETTSAGVTVTGALTASGNIDAGTANFLTDDNGKFISGTAGDLEIYHDGTHNRIDSSNGNIYLRHGTDNAIRTKPDAEVSLYYDDNEKLETTSTGVSITGTLTATGLTLSGSVGAAITAASDGSTITLDLGANTHQSVTLGGNRTFAAPSNQTVGQSGSIFITQDGTGSRTASFNSAFKFVGGTAPTLSTSASAVDRIDYVIKSSNVIHCAISLDVK